MMAVQKFNSYKTPLVTTSRGFTLFEILVVIFIIGVITTFATLSIGNNADQQIEEEAKRIMALARLASEEAIVANKEIGLELGKTRYRFVEIGADGQLKPVADESSPLRPRQLPDGFELNAVVNGEEVVLTDDEDFTVSEKDKDKDKKEESKTSSRHDEEKNPVVIYMLSSGEVIPFIVEVSRENGSTFVVRGDYNGEISYLGKKNNEI